MKLKALYVSSVWFAAFIFSAYSTSAEYVNENGLAYDHQPAQQYVPQYQNYYQPAAQDRQDLLSLGLPVGLAAVLGIGGLIAGLTSVQQGAQARTTLTDSLSSIQTSRMTLATTLATSTTEITGLTTTLAPVTADTTKICTVVQTIANVPDIVFAGAGTDAENQVALDAIITALAGATC